MFREDNQIIKKNYAAKKKEKKNQIYLDKYNKDSRDEKCKKLNNSMNEM